MGERLDAKLVELSLATSRERAKELIKNGFVTVNSVKAKKPSDSVSDSDVIEVTGGTLQYVGRAALKLERAAEVFSLSFSEKICADIGASTGGFTDFMLQNGAKKVYAVDVGHDQLAEKLCNDSRVVNLEGVNVKELKEGFFTEKIDVMTADLSFISLRLALPPMLMAAGNGTELVVLIKPQFEAGKSAVGKGGIVKDKKTHVRVLTDICSLFVSQGCSIKGLTRSGIKGGDGNIEYLIHACFDGEGKIPALDIPKLVNDAFSELKNI